MKTLILAAIVVAFGGANCWARDFTAKDFSKVECGTTLYAWSETTGQPPSEIATGVVKDVADGQGKWIKGQLILQILSPLQTAPDKETCVFDLVSGGYTLIRMVPAFPAIRGNPRMAPTHVALRSIWIGSRKGEWMRALKATIPVRQSRAFT